MPSVYSGAFFSIGFANELNRKHRLRSGDLKFHKLNFTMQRYITFIIANAF